MNKKIVLLTLVLFALSLRLIWANALVERDEGQFAYASTINHVPSNDLYQKWIFYDNKMPLLYIFYSIPITLFGNDILFIRMFNNFLFLISCIFFYKISKEVFKKETHAYISSIFFILLMNIPYFEGQLAMSESIGINFSIWGYYFLVFGKKREKEVYYLLAGIFFFVSVMINLLFLVNFFILVIYAIKNLNLLKNGKLKKIAILSLVPLVLASKLVFENISWISTRILSIEYVPHTNWYIFLLESSFFLILATYGLISLIKDINFGMNKELLVGFFATFAIGFIPNAYGHYFILWLPFFAVVSMYGMKNVLSMRKKTRLFFLVVLSLVFVSNIYFSSLQYPDMNWNRYGFGWMYTDSETREMQEEISNVIKNNTNIDDFIYVGGWEPYVCFRANRAGCMPFFGFDSIDYWLEKNIDRSELIVFYDMFDDRNIRIKRFIEWEYEVILGENYYIYKKK